MHAGPKSLRVEGPAFPPGGAMGRVGRVNGFPVPRGAACTGIAPRRDGVTWVERPLACPLAVRRSTFLGLPLGLPLHDNRW